MEKINTEILVSSLFTIGFDKVDALLYTYTLGQLSIDNQKLQLFEFEDSEPSQKFNDYVDYDGTIFKLKDGVTLETNVSPVANHVWPLGKALHTDKKLIEYLGSLNFANIVQKKARIIGLESLQEKEKLFSSKEKEILYEMFGVSSLDDIYRTIKCVGRATFNPIEDEEVIKGKNLELKRVKK